MNSFTKLLALSVLSLGISFAQFGPGGGRRGMGAGANFDPAAMLQRRIDMLTQRLSLSDTQKTQATKIFTDAQTAAQPLQASIQQNQTSLQAAVKKNDLGAIDQLSSAIGGLHGQVLSIQSKADGAFYAILTPEQQAKYAEGPGGGMGGRGAGRMGRPEWGRQ